MGDGGLVYTACFSLTFIAIQIAKLLKCMHSHTGDLGSRFDTFDDIDKKNCPYPQIASLLLNSYHLFSLKYKYLIYLI